MKASLLEWGVLDKVLTTISRYSMLRPGDRVIAAVSGGADSVCLLHVLRNLKRRLGFTLAGAAHLNHKLRGEAAEEDERFVAELAGRWGVPFFREEARVGEEPGNLEQAARQARRKFFARLLVEGLADRVATGHTRDDQAETVLFRLLRGSGPAGLAGILPLTKEGLIRPLLDVSRAEVEEYLSYRGVAWRVDATNADQRFARNRIRAGLLPRLAREWNPHIREALAHLADVAQEEERWWEAEVARAVSGVVEKVDGGLEVLAKKIAALPRPLARRVVRWAVASQGAAALGFEHVERVLELAARRRGEGVLELPGLRVTRSFGWLRIEVGPASACPVSCPAEIPGRYPWPGGLVCLDLADSTLAAPECGRADCVSLMLGGQGEPSPLELRTWRVGDHYRPAGAARQYTIQELFQRARVPSWRRHSWPIVSMGARIVWARQFGPAAEFAAPHPASGEPGSRWLRLWEERAPNGESPRSGPASNT